MDDATLTPEPSPSPEPKPKAPKPVKKTKPGPVTEKLEKPKRLRIVNIWNQLLNFNHGPEFISIPPKGERVVFAPPTPAVARLAETGRIRIIELD